MASSKEYYEFLKEMTEDIPEISFRKMMGEYIVYFDSVVIGGIYDDRFLVKITDSARRLMPEAPEALPYAGAKTMLLVDNVEAPDFLRKLIQAVYRDLV
ncbi:MAG: TfoX/Sxy family protein [Erysipelotrichaceae bacterium]|nr:TfoX/Sxy family protein [Erysipelotrichaceae bacterium]